MPRYISKAIKIAKQLYYTEATIEAIKNAKSENEVTRILLGARQRGEKR